MANVGSLVVEVAANVAKFQDDMGRVAAIAEQRMAQVDKAVGIVKNSLAAVGVGFAFGATFDAIKSKIEGAIESAAGLKQLAERTGASAEALSGLASVAKLSGTSTDDLALGLQKLSKSLLDAQNGGKLTGASFQAIGISIADLRNKKPDEVFKLVADRLATYQDGAEKTVVAQNLLGKSGANLLPVMNDLAESGDLQAKATQAQIDAADELEKNQIRLKASTDAIYKKIGLELVPVFNDLTKALLEAQNSNDGIRKSVDGLAQDGSIREWAQDSAMAFAILAESMQGVLKLIGSVAGSFSSVFADVKFAGQYLTTASYKDMKKALDERNKIVEEANRRYDDLWNFDSQAIEKKIKARFAASNAVADWASNADARDMRLMRSAATSRDKINPTGLTAANEAEVKRYVQALQALEQQLGKLNNQTEVEKVIYQTTLGSLKDLTAAHKVALIAVAGEIDVRNQRIQVLDSEQAHFAALYAVIQRGEEIRKNAAVGAREQLQNYEFETTLLGKSAAQVQILNAQRQIELSLRSQLRAAAETAGDNNDQYEKEAARLEAIAQTLRESLIPVMKERIALERSAAFGTSEALRKYADDASNSAKQMEGLFTNAFKNMEDALVSFVRTGELDFSKLADSIIADLIRIQVQQSITGPLANMLRGGGGAYSLTGNTSDAGPVIPVFGERAAGGPVSAGMPYLVGEHGPEILVPNSAGTVLPNGQGIGGGGITFSPVIRIDARADRADVYANVQRALQQNNEQFAGMLRQQGVLA